MSSAQIAGNASGHAPADAGAAHASNLPAGVRALWNDLRSLAYDQVRLAALETVRAGRSLADILLFAVAAAVLLVSAWLGLLCVGVLLLVEGGLNLSLALLLAVALNVTAAMVLFARIRSRSVHLGFPASVRSLRPEAPPSRPAVPS